MPWKAFRRPCHVADGVIFRHAKNNEIAVSRSSVSCVGDQAGGALVFLFPLSLCDIEELLVERGVAGSYETIRRWCDELGARFAYGSKGVRRKPGSALHLDEMCVSLRGEAIRPSVSASGV
jgi:hypothetical protein